MRRTKRNSSVLLCVSKESTPQGTRVFWFSQVSHPGVALYRIEFTDIWNTMSGPKMLACFTDIVEPDVPEWSTSILGERTFVVWEDGTVPWEASSPSDLAPRPIKLPSLVEGCRIITK